MINKITNANGGGYILTAILVLIFFMMLSVVLEYTKAYIILNGIHSATENAVIEVATLNWDNIYPSIREGVTGGYKYEFDMWKEVLNNGDVENRLSNLLGINDGVKYSNEQIEYVLSDINTNIINTPMQNKEQMLEVRTDINVKIPFRFLGENKGDIEVNMNIKTQYHKRF